MQHYIRVPLDGSTLSEAILPHAVAAAQATKSALLLLHSLSGIGSSSRIGGSYTGHRHSTYDEMMEWPNDIKIDWTSPITIIDDRQDMKEFLLLVR